jgi:hypothetical protein
MPEKWGSDESPPVAATCPAATRHELAIHGHVAAVDGIFYPSRHHNGLYSVALIERSAPAVTFRRWGTLDDHGVPDLWSETARVLARFDVAVL